MPFLRLLLVLAALGCAVAPRTGAVPVEASSYAQDPLPPATAPLRIPQPDGEAFTLGDLLRELADATGQHLVMSEAARQGLTLNPVLIGGGTEVPPEEIYSFVESVLLFHGYVTAQLKAGNRPILGIYGPNESMNAPAYAVPESQLERFRDHPAFMIQTVVELPNLDVRQASTSLRGLLRNTNLQVLLAVGDHGILLRGTGQWVNDVVALLRASDAQSKVHREVQRQAGTGEEAGEGDR